MAAPGRASAVDPGRGRSGTGRRPHLRGDGGQPASGHVASGRYGLNAGVVRPARWRRDRVRLLLAGVDVDFVLVPHRRVTGGLDVEPVVVDERAAVGRAER